MEGPEILHSEIRSAVAKMNGKKATERDGIEIKMLRWLRDQHNDGYNGWNIPQR